METTNSVPFRTLILCCLCSLGTGVGTVSAQQSQPIIDMHLHTGLPDEIPEGSPALCRPEPCTGTGGATVNPVENLKNSLEEMDRYNIVLAFLSGIRLSEVEQWKAAAPDRFVASPFILDATPEGLETIKAGYGDNTLEGMGEIAVQLG